MANNDDIKAMSDDDLMTEWTALSEQYEVARARLVAFREEHSHRGERERLARLMDLTDEQAEAAMAAAINVAPAGIESSEAVGSEA
jgi:hypothetical protein